MITIHTIHTYEHHIYVNGYHYCTLNHYAHAVRTKRQLLKDPALPQIERAIRKRERMAALAESRAAQ